MDNINLINDNFLNHEIPEDYTIISDPPYNINFKYDKYSDNLSESEYIKLISNFKGKKCVLIHYPEYAIRYFIPALGMPNKIIHWCYNSNLPGKQHRSIYLWNLEVDLTKDCQPYKNPKDKRIKELIKKGKEGARLYDWWSDIQLEKNVTKEKDDNAHPCPVPLKLMERIVKITGQSKYCDPFLGSGTSALA